MVVIANAMFRRKKKWWMGAREVRLEAYGAGYRWRGEEIGYVGSIGSAKGLVLWALLDARFSLVSSRIDAREHFDSAEDRAMRGSRWYYGRGMTESD